jgi:NAD(P)-dependent dehydrogenase (short-subunit alcohol dehydrogenase family)
MKIQDFFKLDGKTAIITGGAGLLGKEFARTLAEAGASVVVADLNEKAAQSVTEDLKSKGYQATAVGVDVTDPDSTQQMVQATLSTYGRLDVLVCSAALDPKFDPGNTGKHNLTFENYPVDLWRQAVDVNLTGLFLSTQAAVVPMKEQNYGSIILICSTYGLVGPDQRIYIKPDQPRQYKPVYYSVTKAGVIGMTHYLSTYFTGTGIRVNALTPGGVENNHDPLFVQNYSVRTVLGRMAQRHEMNGALLFLASDASSYMTGGNLVVDGGWTAW